MGQPDFEGGERDSSVSPHFPDIYFISEAEIVNCTKITMVGTSKYVWYFMYYNKLYSLSNNFVLSCIHVLRLKSVSA
jgi:hypothetical protein